MPEILLTPILPESLIIQNAVQGKPKRRNNGTLGDKNKNILIEVIVLVEVD